ncbi:MAG: hypothetical protein ACUVQ9_12435 [Thermodesulfobacteriota bacterium]
MIRLRSSGVRAFAVILLVGSGLVIFASALHYHEDGRIHEACPLCIFIAHHSDIAVQTEQPMFLVDCYLLFPWEADFIFLPTFHNTFLIRAPPA